MRGPWLNTAVALGALLLASGCDRITKPFGGSTVTVKETAVPEQVFWGDTHLHTDNSPDAFGFGNRLDPEQAKKLRGDLYVKVFVEVPTKLNSRQRELLEEFAAISGHDVSPAARGFVEKLRDLFD